MVLVEVSDPDGPEGLFGMLFATFARPFEGSKAIRSSAELLRAPHRTVR